MIKQNNSHRVLGIMSGTSLDGIDFCLAEFKRANEQWEYQIIQAETIPYSDQWLEHLENIHSVEGDRLINSHFEYGHFLGEQADQFIQKHELEVDLIASHGHTVFHQINHGFTFQLGHGACIAAKSGLPVVSDFRSLDVALGGQGAPLVPFGDRELFGEYEYCINFGGICNLSIHKDENISAYDLCPCNMVLNYCSTKYFGLDFDKNGEMAAQGTLNKDLFNALNQMDYYRLNPPKSLGREWVFEALIPLVESYQISPTDILNTVNKHIAYQIAHAIDHPENKILATGGGAKNTYLMNLLKKKGLAIHLPDEQTIDFKEALIFAFLGLKRYFRKNNTLMSVTGSKKDSCGGTLFFP